MSDNTTECNWKDLGDLDKRMSRLMHRFMVEAAGFQFHGAVILAPVCAKCGALHDWRMTTDISTRPGSDRDGPAEKEALVALLESMAQSVRSGDHDALKIDLRGSYDA